MTGTEGMNEEKKEEYTGEESPENRRHLMNGKETGKCFSASNQPDPELLRKGWARKRALKQLLKVQNPGMFHGSKTDYVSVVAAFFNIPEEHKDLVTVRMIMDYRQIEKAVLKGDTYAYEAVLNRVYGKPAQALTGANNSPLIPPEHKIIHVHSDIPLSDSEENVDA